MPELIDELKALEKRVVARLQELQPELDQLRDVAQRLGIDPDAAVDTRTARSSAASTPNRRRRGSSRAGGRPSPLRTAATSRPPSKRSGGSRAEQVAALVQAQPGITVREAAIELGLKDATSLYRVVRKLEDSGRVVKSGRSLNPVG
jgi:DNA primase